MVKRTLVVVVAVLAFGGTGCSSKLDEARATDLLMQSAEYGPRYCSWGVPRRYSSLQAPRSDPKDRDWASMVRAQGLLPGMSDSGNFAFADTGQGGQGKCAAALDAAGLIKRGDCVGPGCGGCCNRALTAATQGAQLRNDGAAPGGPNPVGRLEFVCGKLEVTRVTSIVTEDRRATVKYVQSVVLDKALLERLDAADCRVDRPSAYKEIGERTRSGFVRDDAGRWSLSETSSP